jgi:hypothetical protein
MANFDWAEYLYISENLLGIQSQNYSEEAIYRVAISRSYYATLIKARNYIETARILSIIRGKPLFRRSI